MWSKNGKNLRTRPLSLIWFGISLLKPYIREHYLNLLNKVIRKGSFVRFYSIQIS
jgi:hypothetical protein